MNLTKNTILTSNQLSLLNKGLTFIPALRTNPVKQKTQGRWDLQQYHRTVKLTSYFENDKTSPPLPFIQKSSWTPPKAALSSDVVSLVDKDIMAFERHFVPCPEPPNITEGEREALLQLQNDKQIIIKPADKGSVVVILDRDQYLWEGYRQLNDKNYYTKLQNPIYIETTPLVIKIAQKLYEKKFINAKQRAYLIGDSEPRARRFYMLPKIHKDPAKWSLPHAIPPGRPIVSDCSSETYYTAEYLDHFLNPLSIRHPAYVKDTYDFVQKIKAIKVPQNAILFTMDVDSLYTNIDIKEGIQAIKNAFSKHPDKKRPDKELLQLLEINLTRNDFEFNGEFYLQIKGTAMGKKFAPAYANIYMAEWEASALATCQKRPTHYYRYLDDIWGLWTHPEEDFDTFLATLNNHNASIKLKAITNVHKIDFLDTTTYKGVNFHVTNTLDVKVFFKETDTHALLYKTSFHPKHTYAGLIKSQLLRFHRICTQKSDFEEATKILFRALKRRGYTRSFLRRAYKTFLKSRPPSELDLLPFITTFSTPARALIRVVKNNFKELIERGQTLQKHRVIAAFRKNPNLQDLLVRATVRPIQETKTTQKEQIYKRLRWIQNKQTQEVYKTCPYGNLKSKNCVYLISCCTCGSQYVGETGNPLSTRLWMHKSNVRSLRENRTPLVQHLRLHGWNSVSITVLQQNPHWTIPQRKRQERIWITRLATIWPTGLNER